MSLVLMSQGCIVNQQFGIDKDYSGGRMVEMAVAAAEKKGISIEWQADRTCFQLQGELAQMLFAGGNVFSLGLKEKSSSFTYWMTPGVPVFGPLGVERFAVAQNAGPEKLTLYKRQSGRLNPILVSGQGNAFLPDTEREASFHEIEDFLKVAAAMHETADNRLRDPEIKARYWAELEVKARNVLARNEVGIPGTRLFETTPVSTCDGFYKLRTGAQDDSQIELLRRGESGLGPWMSVGSFGEGTEPPESITKLLFVSDAVMDLHEFFKEG